MMTHAIILMCSNRRTGRRCKDPFVKAFILQARNIDKGVEHLMRWIVSDRSLVPLRRMAREECVTTRTQAMVRVTGNLRRAR